MKHLSLTLAGLLLMISLFSCGESGDSPAAAVTAGSADESAEAETEEDKRVRDDIPSDLRFSGETFRMLSPDQYDGQCLVEAENGELLNDAVYRMQIETEERLNVELKEDLYPFWDMVKYVNSLVMSGDDTYDSVTMMDRFSLECAMAHSFMPLQSVEYVDITKPYWGGKLADALSVGGVNYFAVSSFNLKSFSDSAIIMFDKKLTDGFQITVPFDKVYDGTWTFDVLEGYKGTATADLNGDGLMDKADQYTYGGGRPDGVKGTTNVFTIGSDIKIASKDENDIPSIRIYDDQQYYTMLERLHSMFYESDGYPLQEEDMNMFMEDRMMICVSYVLNLSYLREMNGDFYILPTPKYTESQSDYITRTYDSMFTMVPITARDTRLSGAVIESLSCGGYNIVLPAYINETVPSKMTRDDNSMKCVDIVFDTRKVDIGETFLFDYFGDAPIYQMMTKKELNVASYMEKIRKKADKQLEKIVGALTESN